MIIQKMEGGVTVLLQDLPKDCPVHLMSHMQDNKKATKNVFILQDVQSIEQNTKMAQMIYSLILITN